MANTRQTIMAGVKTALEAITTANGYNYDIKSVNNQLKLFLNIKAGQTPALFIVDGGDLLIDEIESGGNTYIRATMTLSIVGVVRAVPEADLIDKLQKSLVDIKNAIEGMSLGSNVRYQRCLGDIQPDIEELGKDSAIFIVGLEIGYHYQRDAA